jgi:MtrB/PioB family decaheme-associated outer membrane protein
MTNQMHGMFARSVIAASLLAAFSSALAALPDEMTQLTKPNSEVTFGGLFVGRTNDRFGQFNGLREEGSYGQVDANLNLRDDASGVWTTVTGRNLGRENLEFRFEQSTQGRWNYFLDINRTPRYEPLDVASRNGGIGTATVNIPATGALVPVELKTIRERLAVGFGTQISDQVDASVRVQSEEKNGARYFGQSSTQFAPEPINSTTNQWEAKLGYTDDSVQLSGGYYGSRYQNTSNRLVVAGAGAGSLTPIALAPDNYSHQVFLSGGVALGETTRGTFKASYTRARQDDPFFTAPTLAASSTRLSLNGRVDTTLINLGLTSRPTSKLSLLANVRIEDRDDLTAKTQFVAASASRDGLNVAMSRQSLAGKIEAGYRLPSNYKLVGGIDYERIDRVDIPSLRQASWRARNEEVTGRVELRKSLSDTLNGALKVAHGDRAGSSYLNANSATDSDVIAPVHWTDRKRTKVKATLDWAATDKLSFQGSGERSFDDYQQRDVGPNRGVAAVWSLDAAYVLSDNWQLTGWYTYDQLLAEGGSCEVSSGSFCNNPATAGQGWRKWASRLETKGHTVGAGAKGKVGSKLSVGLDGDISLIRSSYEIESVATGGAAASIPAARPTLPKTTYRLGTLKAYADYAYRTDLSVRAQVQHQRSTTDDWLWTVGDGTPFTYANGTTNTRVGQTGKEIVNVIGLSLTYKWW